MTSLWRVYFTVAAGTILATVSSAMAATLQQSGGTCIIDCDVNQAPIGIPTPGYNFGPKDPLSTPVVDELLPGLDGDRFGPPTERDTPPSLLFGPTEAEDDTSDRPLNYLPGLGQ